MANDEFPKKEVETLWAPWRVQYFEKEPRDRDFLATAGRASDDAEHLVITRRKNAFLMMNRYPYTVGHLMAVPYRKVAELSALGENEVVELWNLGRPRASAFARRGKGAGIQHRSESRRVRGRRCARSLAHPHRAALDRRHELHADHWRRARALGRFARLVRQINGSAGEDGCVQLNR